MLFAAYSEVERNSELIFRRLSNRSQAGWRRLSLSAKSLLARIASVLFWAIIYFLDKVSRRCCIGREPTPQVLRSLPTRSVIPKDLAWYPLQRNGLPSR